jgi:hypothetical protein
MEARRAQRFAWLKVEIIRVFGVSLVQTGVFQHSPSTTTVLYKIALLADNGGNTKPLEG